jgi:hypothetical protein
MRTFRPVRLTLPLLAFLAAAGTGIVACETATSFTTAVIDAAADAPMDASPGDAPTDTSPAQDAAVDTSFPSLPNEPVVIDDCDGGCTTGEYCIAEHFFGGGKRPFDNVADAAPGCYALPAACADAATCACVLAETDAAICVGQPRDCVIDDAGEIVERCLLARP